MLDPDFLQELRAGNQDLMKFLTEERMLQVADFVTLEPQFSDSPDRCFQLPYLACEVFTTEA